MYCFLQLFQTTNVVQINCWRYSTTKQDFYVHQHDKKFSITTKHSMISMLMFLKPVCAGCGNLALLSISGTLGCPGTCHFDWCLIHWVLSHNFRFSITCFSMHVFIVTWIFKVQCVITSNSNDIRASEDTWLFVLISCSASFKIQNFCFKNSLCFSISWDQLMAAFAQLKSIPPHHCGLFNKKILVGQKPPLKIKNFMFSCLGFFTVFIYCEKIFKILLLGTIFL